MKNIFKVIILAAFIAFSPFSARAEVTLPASFTAPLMHWVAAKMQVSMSQLPKVYISRQMMIERIGHPQRQSAMARALYVPNMVVIDDEFWNAGDARTISFLVHELVHHAQYLSGKTYACNNAKEWEAYRLQNLWLAEYGLPAAVDEGWIAHMADCTTPTKFNPSR